MRAAFAAAALFLAGGVVPVIGGVVMLFAPTPVLGYAIGYPKALVRMAAVVTLAAGLIALGAGPSAAGAYALSFGLATAVMVYMIERRHPFETIVLCAAGATIVAGAAAGVGYRRIAGGAGARHCAMT